MRFLARGERRAFGGSAKLLVGPEFQVGLGDIDLRVGEIAAAIRRHDPADVVDVRMGGDDRVDVGGVDAGLLEAGDQPPHVVVALDRAHAGLEQGELVTGIDHEDVLVQHDVVGRQELIVHHLAKFLRRGTAEGVFWVADRQRPVRHHGRLDGSELEAIECRCRRVQHRRLGLRPGRATK